MIDTDNRTNIQQAMRAAFPEAEARVARFYAMQHYHLGWCDSDLQPTHSDPGKLLRPQLTLLSCCAVGGAVAQALPLAAGIQLIHDFSLVHDDIEDNSDMRRGRITVWKKWGLAQGINVGDAMFIVAHLAIHRLSEVGLPAQLVLDVLKHFDETILLLCEGQYLDLSYEGDLSIDEHDYLAMISRKTAALIAGATGLGGMVGGADAQSARALFDFGYNLGLAFQIQDDILGIWGDSAITGKPFAADIYQCKVSLPIIHALRHSEHHDELRDMYQKPQMTEDDVSRVLHLLNLSESQHHCEQMATRYHRDSLRSLRRVRTNNIPTAETALAQMNAVAERLAGRRA